MTPQLSAFFNRPPKQAIDYLQQKNLLPSLEWHTMLDDAHNRAFAVAHLTRLDVLDDIRSSLVNALEQGQTFDQWQRGLKPLLQTKGWWGKDIYVNGAGEAKAVETGSPRRLETIYRTNLQSAYMAGRRAQMLEAVDTHPYWRYVAVLDSRTRPSHRALSGRVMRHDDGAWDSVFPPCGFNCFLPEVEIEGALEGGIRRSYQGIAVEVVTRSGRSLRITGNHPVLTQRGWVAAQMLNPADQLLAYARPVESTHGNTVTGQVNDQQPIACAEDLFEAIWHQTLALADMTSLQLYRDVLTGHGKIDIDVTDCGLVVQYQSGFKAGLLQLPFIGRDDTCQTAVHVAGSLTTAGPIVVDPIGAQDAADIAQRTAHLLSQTPLADQGVGVGFNHSALQLTVRLSAGFPGGLALLDDSALLFDGLPLERFGLGSAAQEDTLFSELARDGAAADAGLFGYLIDAQPLTVSVDPVIKVRQFDFCGHVYDFQSQESMLAANGLIVHNCRCRVVPMTAAAVERGGYTVESSAGHLTNEVVPVGDGQQAAKITRLQLPSMGAPFKTDAGFNSAPGQGVMALALQKAMAADPLLGAQAVSAVLSQPALRAQLNADVRAWIRSVDTLRTKSELQAVGVVAPEFIEALRKQKRIEPVNAVVVIHDRETVAHVDGELRKHKVHDPAWFENIVGHLAGPQELWWDEVHQVPLLMFDVTEDRALKVVIRLDHVVKWRLDGVRRKDRLNLLRTIGVEWSSNLKNSKQYHKLAKKG